MIYLSGVKGRFPVAETMPPALGRYERWDWHRLFGIIHWLLERPYDQDAYGRAIYAFQNLPPDMVFSDPVVTAAWARFVNLYSGHDREMALSYLSKLPRMTGRFRTDDSRNWYEVEKEWQASERKGVPAPNLTDALGSMSTWRYEKGPPPPPPPPRRVWRGQPEAPPDAPPVRKLAPPREPPPRPGAVRTAPYPPPPAEMGLPVDVAKALYDKIMAENLAAAERARLYAGLTEAQKRELERRDPDFFHKWFVHEPEPRKDILTPKEAFEERSYNFEFSLSVRGFRARMDNVLRWHGQTKYRLPAVAIPGIWRGIVTQVYNFAEPKVTRAQVELAVRLRGYYPAGEGVLSMGERARREFAAKEEAPGPLGARNREPDPIRAAIDLALADRGYPSVAVKPTVLQFWNTVEASAYGLAVLYNRKDWKGIYRFTRADVQRALRGRGYHKRTAAPKPPPAPVVSRPPPAPVIPKTPPPYDRYKDEAGPIREAVDDILKKWRGLRYPTVAPALTRLPSFLEAVRKAYSYAKTYNASRWKRRFSFTRDDVQRAFMARNYRQHEGVIGGRRIAVNPPPPPPISGLFNGQVINPI